MNPFHILACSFLLLAVLNLPLQAWDFNSPGSPEEIAQKIIDEMDDEDALAQTFMLGWVGAAPSPIILDWIRERRIGGIKIFGWNTDDTLKLAESVGQLQKISLGGKYHIPLLVATDQEGGWVRHVKGSTSETPGNMAIGASGFPRDAYYSGFYIGRELAVLGVNMNFAPSVDLYTNRGSKLIGPRAFGDNPANAGILGAAFVKGHKDAGIIATAKHFPGHGDTDLDSHGILPKIDAGLDTLWERELVPYRILAREKIPAIMSGHLAFPQTPAGAVPASLSKWMLTDLLREKIGYTGIIITDDLMMNGATLSAGSLSRAAKEALLAGNDIIMLSKTPNMHDSIWTSLLESMKKEPGFRARVRDAASRVLKLKLEYLRGEKAVPCIPDLEKVKRSFPDAEGEAFFLDLAARCVTLVKGSSGDEPAALFPLAAGKAGKVLLAGNFPDFFSSGRDAFPGAASFWYSSSRTVPELRYAARQADTVIFCLADENGLSFLNGLKDLGRRVIVISVLNPVYIEETSWVDGALAVYSYAPSSFVAAFSAMLGRIPFQGVLPFSPGKMDTVR